MAKVKEKQDKRVHGLSVHEGLPLVDKDSNYVGKIKEIRKAGLIIDRSALHCPDLFIPYDACLHNGPDQIKVELAIGELDEQGWPEADTNK